MRRWLVRLGALVCVVLVLVAGLVVGQRNGLICFSERSGGPPTTTTGPVTMSTDHSVYATSDTITVTLTNHLNTEIALLSAASPSGTCPIFLLSKLGYGPLTPCLSGGELGPVVNDTTLGANSSAVVTFESADLATPLTDGTYQVVTLWVPAPFRGPASDASRHATSIVSQAFRVCTCRIC